MIKKLQFQSILRVVDILEYPRESSEKIGRDTGSFQQKVDLLFEMIMNCHRRREHEQRMIEARSRGAGEVMR